MASINDDIRNIILSAREEKELADIEAELAELLTDEEYAAAEESLYAYLIAAWPYIDSAPFKNNWHLEAICEHVQAVFEGKIKDLVITVPPRHAKSTLINVAFPTWAWIKDPTTKFITASYGADLATRDAVKSRRLMNHPWFKRRWKDKFNFTTDSNVKTRYDNDKTGYRLSTSVGGVGTGEGFDCLVIDDAMKAADANSAIKREAVIEWWDQTMSTRANDPENQRRIVIGQRLHEDDLPGYLIKQGGWTHLNFPVRYEPTTYVTSIGWKDPRKKEGQLLWPERYDELSVEKLEKQLGPYGAASQLQQRPVPKGGGLVKDIWFKRYFYAPPLKDFDIILQSWDFAFDSDGDAAYSVGDIWGKLGADIYLLDQVRDKWDITEMMSAVEELSEAWPQARVKLFENKAAGKPLFKMLKSKISGIVLIDPKEIGDKEVRLQTCIPEIYAGNVYIPHPNTKNWVSGKGSWLEEITMFPKFKYKDRVDTMTQAINWLMNNATRTKSKAPVTQEGSRGNIRSIFTAPSSYGLTLHSRKNVRGIFG